MTTYRLAWLTLIDQRDALYLQLAALVAVGSALYLVYSRLWPHVALKMAVVWGGLGLAAALFAGFLLWGQ